MPVDRDPILTKQSERGVRDGASNLRTRTLNEVSNNRKLWFYWNEREDALKRYLGYNDLHYDENNYPTSLIRLAPMQHPDSPWLYVTRFNDRYLHKVVGKISNSKGDRSISATYDKVDVELIYERLPYRPMSDDDPEWNGKESFRYVSIGEKKATADYITIPGGSLKYIAPITGAPVHGKLIQYNNGIVTPTMEFPVTWHRLPAALWNYDIPNYWTDKILGTDLDYSYIGTINKTQFKGFPAGTLLLTNVCDKQCPAPVDTPDIWSNLLWLPYEIDIIFTMHFNPQGWNYLYYNDITGTTTAGKSGWYFVGRGTTEYDPGTVPDEYSLYNEREFDDLFVVGI